MDYTTFLYLGITAILLSMLLMPLVMRIALTVNAIDMPDARRVHKTAIPTLGGFAIAISFTISCLLFLSINPLLEAFFIGLGVITLTGVADDIWHINPALKFVGEISASLIFILWGGGVIHTFGDLIGVGSLTTGAFAIPITVFCMVGVMNALNFADGLDGLAGGISVIASLFLAYFAYLSNAWLYLGVLLALCGSLLGFLYYNKYPAKVFMGDTGSLVLGYVLSAICILLVQKTDADTQILPISMAIVMGLPIVDALIIMTNRMLHGKNPFSSDNTHLHHRLLALGFSHAKTVKIIYLLMISCGLLAILLQLLNEWLQFTLGIIYAGFIFGVVYYLDYLKESRYQNSGSSS